VEIVREHVEQFRDSDLARKVHERARAAQEVVTEALHDAIRDEMDKVETLAKERAGVLERGSGF
jgi:hypothetical protein